MSGWAELPPIATRWWGRVAYEDALAAQRAHREAVLADPATPEVVWTMEHPPVITTGLRAVDGLPDAATLAARGVALVATERGGLATYHGPGQVVGAVIVRLRPRGLSVPTLIRSMEEGIAAYLTTLGVPCGPRPGAPGVWCAAGKLASVGVHIRRGVSLHGFAVNLDVDLAPFRWFQPCGFDGAALSSVAAAGGRPPATEEAAAKLTEHVLWSLYANSVDSPSVAR